MPELPFNNYQQFMNDLINWKNFKNYYVEKNGESNVKKQLEFLHKV